MYILCLTCINYPCSLITQITHSNNSTSERQNWLLKTIKRNKRVS